jgi:hypothetical protein
VTLERLALGMVFGAVESYVGDRNSLARLNFLIPSANVTPETFAQELEDAGARVDSVAAYRTTPQTHQLTRLKTLIAGGGIDAFLFSNTSELQGLAQLFDTDDLGALLPGMKTVCADIDVQRIAVQFGLLNPQVANDWTGLGIIGMLT